MKTFKQEIPRFCPEGRQWAQQQLGLRTAWKCCQNGCWMAWWLFIGREASLRELLKLARTVGINAFLSGNGVDPVQQRHYAELLRKTYYPSGRRRSR